MIRFFRTTGAGPVLMLLILAAASWTGFLVNLPGVSAVGSHTEMPLWGLITESLDGLPLAAVLVSFLLMALMMVILVSFNTSLFFIQRRTYYPALFYLLLFSLFPGEMILNPVLPAAVLIVLGLWRMMAAYRLNGLAYNLFDAALIVSSAGLFYGPAVLFAIVVLAGSLMLRTPDPREISLTLFGAALPWVIFYSIWFLIGRDLNDLTVILRDNVLVSPPAVHWSRTLIILLATAAVWILAATASLVPEMSSKKVKSRKIFSLLLWILFLSAALVIFVPAVSAEIVAIAAVPLAYIMANSCAFSRRVVFHEIMFWLVVIMIGISRIWPV